MRRSLIGILCKNVDDTILESNLKNLETYVSCFDRFKILFVDGYSDNETLPRIHRWKESHPEWDITIRQQTLCTAVRPLSLANARNDMMEWFEGYMNEYDFVLIMDFNQHNVRSIVKDDFLACFGEDPSSWDALFPNQTDQYYDIWALRTEECPYDYQKHIRQNLGTFIHKKLQNDPNYQYANDPLFHCYRNQLLQDCLEVHKTKIPTDSEKKPVWSAFGGAGLYRIDKLRGCRYSSHVLDQDRLYEVCEHVPFHEQLREKGGRLWICPRWINA